MKKILLLLILSFFSAQSFAGSCPDGSEPVKSISADGTYFVYNCGGSSSVDNKIPGTVEVAMKPDRGDWIPSDINGAPMWSPLDVKRKLTSGSQTPKYLGGGGNAFGDFDNDGIVDYFQLGIPRIPGISYAYSGPACEAALGDCFLQSGNLSVFKIKQIKTKKIDGKYTSAIYTAVDSDDLLINNNSADMAGTGSNRISLADFNGDGKLDIFTNDGGVMYDGKWLGKNDNYYLSNKGVGWTESNATHVTGTGVKKGKGLKNFSHGSSVGDIDGDGDIDIVVTSGKWVGYNGELLCYMNQGDGHMVVRKCGNQWGFTAELGDIDNDGDLDIVFGSAVAQGEREMGTLQGCCQRHFNGILLNDGTGNFYERGFAFKDAKNSSGFTYTVVFNIAVSDLDADGDLDVVRMLVGHLYSGASLSIEENIGNGQFRNVLLQEWCKGPKTLAEYPRREGGSFSCHASDFMFGDFNKDGLIDIVVQGSDIKKSDEIKDGAVYMSTGKFEYDIILPTQDDYPFVKKMGYFPKKAAEKAQSNKDEDAELAAAIAKRKTEVAAAKAKRLAEEAANKIAETETVNTEQSVEDELAAFEAELAAELGE